MEREPRRRLRFAKRETAPQKVVEFMTDEQRAQHMLRDLTDTEYMDALDHARDAYVQSIKLALPGNALSIPPYVVSCIARDAVDEFLRFVRDQAAKAPYLREEGES